MSIDKMSRVEDILHATLGDISESELQPPQSRVEALLQRLEDKIDEISEGGGKLPIHICTSSEYNPLTGIPTIQNPVEDTFYLVPDGTGNNLYTEWIYTNGVWDYVGGTNSTGGDGSVHYDTAQSLSDGDKARARLNISAAEAGDVDDLKSQMQELSESIGGTETITGNYHVLSPDDGYIGVYADSDVIVGNKNMLALVTDDVVGQRYTSGGITRVRNADDTYTFSGVATRTYTLTLDGNIAYLPAGEYTLSGCPVRSAGQTFGLYADQIVNGSRSRLAVDTGNGKTGTLQDGYTKLIVYCEIPNGTDLTTPITLKAQLEHGSTATEYVKCANNVIPANTDIPISDPTYIFAKDSFVLTLNKNDLPEIRQRLSDAEDDIDDLQTNVELIGNEIGRLNGEVEVVKESTLKPYPQNHMDATQMITIEDGADNLPMQSMVVNVDYTGTARSKIRAFVSTENMFDLDDVITKNHITKNADGTISVQLANTTTSIYTGLYGTNGNVPSDDMDRLPFLPAGRYYITTSDAWVSVAKVDSSTGANTVVAINNDHGFTLDEDSLINIFIRNTVDYVMLSAEPHTSYVLNGGKTYVVPFSDVDGNEFTLYGGTVDLVNGVVTELYDSNGDELVAPIVHNIEPVEVNTCLGYNHIWSDCTSVSITYRADVKMYVDQRNKSDALEQYNIDASEFGVVRIGDFMSPNTNVIAVAHRGLSRSAPENTIPAFKAAAEAGFLVAETDVDWTSDGVPVLIHDSTINRTARNADGTEITSTISIRDITYAQALEYDFGIWKGEEFAGTKIPTFDEFILFCKRAGICPQIELKYNQQTQEQTNLLIQKVVAHGMINRVSWVSNFKDLLLQVLSVHQGAFVVLVGSNEARYNDIVAIKSLYPAVNTMLTCGIDYMTSEEMTAMIARLKAAMVPMGIWTIDNSATIKSLDPYITAITSNMLNAATVLREAALE